MVLAANVEPSATGVPVDTIISASAEYGTLDTVTLATSDGETTIEGQLAGGTWIAGQRLEPATSYTLRVSGLGDDGHAASIAREFTTQELTLDEQTYPAVAPLHDETVGIGMPVIVRFDLPVKNRALFERNMQVEATPAVAGSWTWLSDREAHYRPEQFWAPGTKVRVVLRTNSLPAGDGIYGQQDQDVTFTIGSSVVSTVDIAKHTLSVTIDGQHAKTFKVSTGDKDHQTRRGTKVIMEKFVSVDMDAATTGVDSTDPDYYNLKGVKWAMRVTNSGEFIHAAPWSVGAQGSANVSHGCTGMSTADAKWLFDRSKRGDVVHFINSDRPLEDRNGWTDWNVDWADWVAGSALGAPATT